MKNITHGAPTVKTKITVHRISKELIPQEIKDQLIEAAIVLSMRIENLEVFLHEDVEHEAVKDFNSFADIVCVASNYTEKVEVEIDRPIIQ